MYISERLKYIYLYDIYTVWLSQLGTHTHTHTYIYIYIYVNFFCWSTIAIRSCGALGSFSGWLFCIITIRERMRHIHIYDRARRKYSWVSILLSYKIRTHSFIITGSLFIHPDTYMHTCLHAYLHLLFHSLRLFIIIHPLTVPWSQAPLGQAAMPIEYHRCTRRHFHSKEA